MSIDITTEQRGNFLVVSCGGATDSTDEIMAYVDGFLALSADFGQDRILLDHRKLQVQMEHAGAYDVATRCIERMVDDRDLRVALVSRPERMEFARIYESIGLNRGVDIKAFESMEMAASWLTL